MTPAMYAAIAGLKTHMNRMSVIGNNIANVNTYGYKAARMTFQDSMYMLSQAGSNGTATVGGRNPSQIGYGVGMRSIDLDMSTGSFAATGYPTDCMITGDGFFLTGDKTTQDYIDPSDAESLKTLSLSRVGDFYFGPDGYLVDSVGNVVYGFLNVQNPNYVPATGTTPAVGTPTITSTVLTPIRLPMAKSDGSEAMPVQMGLNTNADGSVTEVAGTDNTAQRMAVLDTNTVDTNGNRVPEGTNGATELTTRVQYDTLAIDGDTGRITCVNTNTDEVITIGYIALGKVDNPNGLTHESGPYYKAMDGAGDLRIVAIGGSVSGYINAAIPTGNNPATPGIDEMFIGSSGDSALVTGGLEMSKADLATEISEMITTQRGYQANTRIITVTDTMLEELVNLKR